METVKKIFLVAAAAVCVILLISPADFMPGVGLDDILYVIGAIASAAVMRSPRGAGRAYDYE